MKWMFLKWNFCFIQNVNIYTNVHLKFSEYDKLLKNEI